MPVFHRLVEHAQHTFKTVVHLTAQQRYLHDDAVVYQAVDKRVRQALDNLRTVVVERLVADIEHRHLNVAHTMAQQIYRHHRYGMPVAVVLRGDVLRVGILRAEILAEAQRLRLKPRLLELYQYKVAAAVRLPNLRREVDAEHRNLVARAVGVLMTTDMNLDNILLQQCREQRPRDALVLNEVLEHRIVYRIGNMYHHTGILLFFAKVHKKDDIPVSCVEYLHSKSEPTA